MWKVKIKWFHILIIGEVALVMILLATCFGKDELRCVYYGDDMYETATLNPENSKIVTAGMKMSAGVYRVNVKSSMDTTELLGVTVCNNRGYTDSLLDNSIIVFGGNDDCNFDFFLTDTAYGVYLDIDYGKTDLSQIQEISIWKTRGGNRILLFITLLFFTGIDAVLYFRSLCIKGLISRKGQIVIISLVGLTLLQYVPYYNNSMIFQVDIPYHILRIESLANAIKTGEAFPYRITSYWLSGHGYASSLFYGDLFLMFPTLLRVMGFSIMTAYKIFMFVVMGLTCVITYVSFQRCVRNEYAALLGTMAYVLAPYRFNNFYIRSAVGEYLAMSFIPMVFCGFYLLCTEDIMTAEYKKYKWWIIFGMSAILECHLLTTEMVAICLAALCLLLIRKVLRKQTFIQMLEATGIVLLWNSWFYIPMLYMMNADVYRLQRIISRDLGDGMELASALVFWQNGRRIDPMGNLNGRDPFSVGSVILLFVLGYIVYGATKKMKTDKTGVILTAFCLLAIFMNSKVFPWDKLQNIPLLGMVVSSIQFPFRWIGISILFGAALVAYEAADLMRKKILYGNLAIAGVLLVGIVGTSYQLSQIVMTDYKVQLYTAANMGTSALICGEYLLTDEPEAEFTYHDPIAEDPLTWNQYEKRGTNIEIHVENPTDKSLLLELPLQGYKGYQAVDEKGKEVMISEERGAHGDLKLIIPAAYSGNISVSYVGFPIFRVAEGITVISIMSSVIWGVNRCIRRRKRGIQNENIA